MAIRLETVPNSNGATHDPSFLHTNGHLPQTIDSAIALPSQPLERFRLERIAVMTEDMPAFARYTFDKIFGNNLSEEKREEALAIARDSLATHREIVQEAFPGRDYIIPEPTIDRIFGEHVERVLKEDPEAVIVINDRFVAQGLDTQYPNNIFRWSSTRIAGTIDNNTGDRPSITRPRPGDPPFDQQLDNIEAQLQKTGRTLKGARVVLADDTTATNGTEKKMAAMFEERGAKVDRSQSIYTYVIFTDGYNPDNDRVNSGGISVRRNMSAEQRELGPHGGPVVKIGDHVAVQQPAQAPWGDGVITRTDGFVNRQALDIKQLQTFLDVFGKLEQTLQGVQRTDGTEFKQFTLADFRWMIPTGKSFGPSDLIRDFVKRNGAPPQQLSDLSMLRYVELALEKIQDEPKPEISHAVVDLDGTVLEMMYSDPDKRSFSTSELGKQVINGFEKLFAEFNAENIGEPLNLTHIETPTLLLKERPDFAAFLEREYGEVTKMRLTDRFNAFYGMERGPQEMQEFLTKYHFLPLSYHALREFTWGATNMAETHGPDDGKAQVFAQEFIQKGGEIIFLTAAPKIHAMRNLVATGLNEMVLSGKARLITVEDLYHPTTLREQDKNIVFTQLHAQGVHPKRILGIGDQPHSDARAAIAEGGYGMVVNGPDQLTKVFEYASVRKTTPAKRAQQNDAWAIDRVRQFLKEEVVNTS